MRKNITLTLLLALCALVCKPQSQYVNPLVGTAEHGHTFPGAIVPFGAVQVSPDTRLEGWDGCSGYHYTDNRIYGFSHTHLSGTGCSDYGDVLIMPFTGTPSIHNSEYSSTFSHKNEHANAGYYHVMLNNGIYVELTAGKRVAMHRYTFPKKGAKGFVIDLTHRDKVLASGITINGNEIVGFRRSEAWNPDQYCAFSIIPSSPIQKIEFYKDDKLVKETDVRGENCKAIVYFSEKVKTVTLNVAISAVDIAGAMNNQKELQGKTIEQVMAEAVAAWDKELGKIKVESANKEYLKTFYTALYHCFTSPYLYSDLDGRYRGQAGEIHEGDGKHQMYTVFSLWDTYRSLHPLLNIIDRKRTEDFLYTFMQHYRQGGMLPVWELSAFETWCMIGYHSVPVILDAYVKGIHPYNPQEMLKAMVHSAKLDKLGRTEYARYGYLPGDADNESVSKTLEYAYDDWCISEFARLIGDDKTKNEFAERALFYRNILDPNGFMHGKINGGFVEPFNPTEVNNFYTEANSWQYSTYAPQDLPGYIKMMGGMERTESFLDRLFTSSSVMTGREQSDITGVIGQYAHGNEPSHHAAYLYK
ncbi:MAG: GH92 family glycosyl hydrolase [Bacteroidales bacterium]|nr:GH92 family glycosyl hydrolase [Bacteroidales bacterium]